MGARITDLEEHPAGDLKTKKGPVPFSAPEAILGIERQEFQLRDFDIKDYAKHVLKSGATDEKRQILSHLKNKILTISS